MDKEERIKQINIENNIWIIYLIIIGLSYYANYYEKLFFESNNPRYKNKYRKINGLVFTILIIIYSYFENDAINSYKNNKTKYKNTFLSKLILIATTLVLISGIIFLYVIIKDNDLEEEIAFN